MASEAQSEGSGLVFHPMDQFIVKPLFGNGGAGVPISIASAASGGAGHDYVAKLLSVAGDDAPPRTPALYYPHLQGDDQGSVCGWRWRKRSAEAAGGPREECYVPRRAEREYVPGV